MKIKFYDTSALLLEDHLFSDKFAISSITISELEDIKNNAKKDADIKFKARKIIAELENHPDDYELIIYKSYMINDLLKEGFEVNNDLKILATAISYNKDNDVIFITNDLTLKQIAKVFDMPTSSIVFKEDDYHGYLNIVMSDEEMSEFYSNLDKNTYDLFVNQYMNIYDEDHNRIDTVYWDGSKYQTLTYKKINARFFGEIKPKDNDIYQNMLIDSFQRNKLTMARGPAGSGKSFLSLGYLFYLLEQQKIDKIIIFCNTIAARGAAKLGYLPGTKDEKLLESQIGNMLASKLGGQFAVEQMILKGSLVLLPRSDIRGYDTSGMRAGIYITEAQNLDIYLMKLFLQRLGEDSFCIIDGDDKSQVDDVMFAGANNGMKRVSKVFRGQDFYGEVELRNIYRSKIAKVAEEM